jgi:hypothetical protein
MYWPFFQLGCNLEINTQRTAAYVDAIPTIAMSGSIDTRIDLKCDCPPLAYVFDALDVPQPATYITPQADQVAWFDADIPESARFLGFMISDVQQTTAVTSRSITTRISSSGGGSLGPLRNRERRLDFTVLMFACDEAAMEYGFRYLMDALASSGCDDGCVLCDAEFRESCPPINSILAPYTDLNRGRWLLKNVGLVDGPVWDTNPVEDAACNIRRVKFSLVSEMPWKFKCPVAECTDVALAGYPSAGVDCVNWDDILCGQQEVACSVSENLIVGETGLIIRVKAGSVPLQHIEIAIRPDKFGYEAAPLTRPSGYVRVDPCDLIYIPYLPAGQTLVYDTSIESMYVEVPGGGTYDATPLIATEEGRAPTFPTLRCGEFCISVAVSECSVEGGPTVSVSSVHREI